MAALLSGFLAASPGHAKIGENMLPNGGFESGDISPYGVYSGDGETTADVVTYCDGASFPEGPAEGTYCLHVVVPPPEPGENDWDVGMADNSYTLKKGKRYVFSCFMKCKSDKLQVRLKPERGEDPYEAYNDRVVTVTKYWQKFSVMTPIMPERVTPASPTFHFNFAAGDFWIDDVRLCEVWDEGATYTWTGAAGDLQWPSSGNWESSASIYTWPNEEFGFPRVNQDAGEIIIGNGDMVACGTNLDIRSGAHGSGEACLIIEKSSGLVVSPHLAIAAKAYSRGRIEVRNGSSLIAIGEGLSIAQGEGSVGALDVVDAALDVGLNLSVGGFGLGSSGTMESKNSCVTVQDTLYVGRSDGAAGMVEVKDGVVEVGNLVQVAYGNGCVGTLEIRGGTFRTISLGLNVCDAGAMGRMVVKGDATINIGKDLRMNNSKAGQVSELVMDGGVVNVASRTYVNYRGNASSQADFTLHDGTWNSGTGLHVGNTPNGGDACLTINGGTMDTDGWIWVGSATSGQSRIFLNGGLLQAEGLAIKGKDVSDSLIVFRGGELWVNGSSLPEAAMQYLIDQGSIEVPDEYEITTIDGYTVLRLSGM